MLSEFPRNFTPKAAIFFCGALFLLSLGSPLKAQTARALTLAWNPSSDPSVTGYCLLYGTASGNYADSINLGNTNTTTISNLTVGNTYYFAVTAYNSLGVQSVPSNQITAVAQTLPGNLTALWPDATDLGGGWCSSNWFGTFNINDYPWIYHAQHAWMYAVGTDPTSIWLYSTSDNMGFLWTSSTAYPWLWSNTEQTWLYYEVGSQNPRLFFNQNTQQWEQHSP